MKKGCLLKINLEKKNFRCQLKNVQLSTQFFKCLSDGKGDKEREDPEQRGFPVSSTISQVPVGHPSLELVQPL